MRMLRLGARRPTDDDDVSIAFTQQKKPLSDAEIALLSDEPSTNAEQSSLVMLSGEDDNSMPDQRYVSLRCAPDDGGVIANLVWTGGITLARVLQAHFGANGMRHWRCVELGSGTGVVGIAAAILGAHVLLTDLKVALPYLRLNLATNLRPNELKNCAPLEYAWGEPPDALRAHALLGGHAPDAIFCGDLLYFTHLVQPLCSSLIALAGQRTIVLCLAVLRPGTAISSHYEFFATLARGGFTLRRMQLDQRDRYLVLASREPCFVHQRRPNALMRRQLWTGPRGRQQRQRRHLLQAPNVTSFDVDEFMDMLGPGPTYQVLQ